MSSAPRFALLCTGAAAIAALGGCNAKEGQNADLVAGKKLFVQKCGSCHILARAGTKGTIGPNLDEAFQQPSKEGFGESAIRAMVHEQIQIARDPKYGGVMPQNLVRGQQAWDVASYVAQVVSKPGKDTGLLATAVQAAQSAKPAIATNGTLSIPADPTGQLLFQFKSAEAPPGKLTIEMPNKSGVQHDITIDGKGKGPVVANGTSSFSATFAAGTYTFYCSVPGHREAGMVGKLTVK
jgi:plastocyanin